MKKTIAIISAVMLVITLALLWTTICHAEEDAVNIDRKAKSFAGVAWNKGGDIVWKDEGVEFVNPFAFSSLSSENFFEHSRKTDLNVDCMDWKYEKSKKAGLEVLSKEELLRREALKKMSPKERFRIALAASGIAENEQDNYVVIVEKVVYPDTKSKGLTYWYTFVSKAYWKTGKE